MTEFQLRGLFLGTDTTGNLSPLGKPLRITTDSGVDDGGRYERKLLHYAGFQVAVVRGAVDELVIQASNVATPAGLKSGLTLSAVQRILSSRGVTLPAVVDTVDIANCENQDGAYTTLVFDGKHLRTIDIAANRP